MRKLIDLQAADLLERGMFPDMPKNQQELWAEGQNVQFEEGGAKLATGWTEEEWMPGTVWATDQAYIEGIRRAYIATAEVVYKWEYGTLTEIGDGFEGLGYWSLVPWGNWLIATNDYDVPQVWKNAGMMGPLADAPVPRFRLMKKHKNHVLGYIGQTVYWSDESNPEVWSPTETNKAGDLFIRDLDSDIVTVTPIGANFAIYSFDTMVVQNWIGAPLVFGFSTAIDGIGGLSDTSAVGVANKNYGMCGKGFFVTDGISFDYIDRPAIKKWVFDQFNVAEQRRVVGLHDEEAQIVKWWFPCLDGQIRGVGFNYRKSSWSIYFQQVTAAASKSVYDFPLIGAEDKWGFHTGATAGGVPQEALLRTFPLDSTKRENYKLWDMLRCDFEGEDLEVRFGFQDTLKDAIEWTDFVPIETEMFPDRECVFLTVEFRSIAAEDFWKLTGVSIHGEITGGV